MIYWQNSVVSTGLVVALLLAGAELLRRLFPVLRRVGIPGSIIAGVVGLILGPDLVDLLPLDREILESVVYHGLAVVFIAVGLQPPDISKGRLASGIKAFSFGIPLMETLQAFLGLGSLLLLGLLGFDGTQYRQH